MDKADIRRRAFAARAEAHGTGRDEAANAALLREIGDVAGRVISAYWPMRTEIDPRPAITALAAANRICLPVIAGKGLPLTFREWSPGAAMTAGPFGAEIPAEGEMLTPDILIVPLVAFDAAGDRLGYGGGFYDRTLAKLRAAGRVRAIGFAYAAQQMPEVPVEPTDQRLDVVVTEDGPAAPLARARDRA
ncbi:5-formyltetrahydrofolate cyclo-ligase [Rhodobacterales bacterium HKCCE2091]|nr:5-formyltetrahydrofolate cyclo-ligase [Rhodobacterales bacterium HKCCE2091]